MELNLVLCDNLERVGMWWGGWEGGSEGGNICILRTDSHWWRYPPIKSIFWTWRIISNTNIVSVLYDLIFDLYNLFIYKPFKFPIIIPIIFEILNIVKESVFKVSFDHSSFPVAGQIFSSFVFSLALRITLDVLSINTTFWSVLAQDLVFCPRPTVQRPDSSLSD